MKVRNMHDDHTHYLISKDVVPTLPYAMAEGDEWIITNLYNKKRVGYVRINIREDV